MFKFLTPWESTSLLRSTFKFFKDMKCWHILWITFMSQIINACNVRAEWAIPLSFLRRQIAFFFRWPTRFPEAGLKLQCGLMFAPSKLQIKTEKPRHQNCQPTARRHLHEVSSTRNSKEFVSPVIRRLYVWSPSEARKSFFLKDELDERLHTVHNQI